MLVPLPEAEDERDFGADAVKLGAALRAGLPIPPGYALSHDHGGDLRALSTLDAPLAVRSSAVGEEGPSFAGRHATVVGVLASDLVATIERVRASAHSAGALAYRARLGLTGNPRMGVVVQRLVQADVAGVLVTRGDERWIEASWGCGDAVVTGLVTPDRFRLAHGRVLERRAGLKDIALRLVPGGRTVEETIAPERADALCLDDTQLDRLAALDGACGRVFGPDHELEWAFSGGELYLVRWRRILT